VCPGCKLTFPILLDTLPVLVRDPVRYLTGERAVIQQFAATTRQIGERYRAHANTEGIRSDTLNAIADGLDHNATFMGRLEQAVPPVSNELDAYVPAPASDLFGSLRRDWGGSPEAEEELAIMREAVMGAVRDCTPRNALVLGAGAGRMTADLALEYPFVAGLDLCLPLGLAATLLDREQSFDVYNLLGGNFYRAEDEAERVTCRRDASRGDCRYVIADATRIPYADNQFDAVFSLYFSDLVPFSRFIPEVRRVLQPHGRFVHFGPLGYAFEDESEKYAVDQIPSALAEHGLRLQHQEYVACRFLANRRRFHRVSFDCLLFTATPERSYAPPIVRLAALR